MGWVQIVVTIISYVVQRAQQKKAAARAKQMQEEQERQAALLAAQSRGLLLNVEANDSPLPVPYGLRRMGGITCLKETSGSTNEKLHKVVALGEGPIQGVMNHYLDNIIATASRFTGVATFEDYVGTDGQAASAALISALPGKWSSAHQGKGVAYLYAALTWSDNAWQGEPVITADVYGRLLYDPRDGQTRFSNNPALVIRDYLTNTRYGRGVDSSAIDDDSFIAAANHCDERVSVPAHSEACSVEAATDLLRFDAPTLFGLGDGVCFAGAAPGGLVGGSPTVKYYYIPVTEDTGRLAASYADALAYQPSGSPSLALDITSGDGSPQFVLSHVDQARYQLDGVVDVEQTPLDNVNMLRSACRGYIVYSAGKYKLKCDQAEAASGFVFDEDNIVGPFKFQGASLDNRYNRVSAKFFNPARQWQPDFAVFESGTYRTEDNDLVLETEINLPYTANVFRALRHAQLECRQSRLGLQCNFRSTIAALRNEVGDVVQVTHSTPGWTLKKFRVDALELRPDDEVDVWLSEYDDGAYDLDPLAEVRTAPATSLPSPFGNLDIEDLVATSGTADLLLNGDGTVVPRVRLRWTPPANAFLKEYQVQYARLDASPTDWFDAPRVSAPANEAFAQPVEDGVSFDLRMRAVTQFGNAGEWAYVLGHTVAGKSEPPSDVTGFSALQTGATIVFGVNSVEDADLDLIEIRLGDLGNENWDDAQPLTNILRGRTTTSSAAPPGSWTFLAKARDTSGNYSTNAASFDLAVTADGFTEIASRSYETAWQGGLTNMVRHWTGVLTPESQSLASALGWEVFDQFVPNAETDCYYTPGEIDKAINAPARIWGDIVSVLGPGETTGTASPDLEVDYKTASGSYDGYEAWTIGNATFRYCKGRIHVDTTVGKPVISAFSLTIDAASRLESGTLTVGAGGNGAVTFATEFHSAPVVQVTPQGSGDVTASAASITTTGFTGYFKTAGVAGAGTMNYTATGV